MTVSRVYLVLLILYCIVKCLYLDPINILNSTFSNRSAPDRAKWCGPSGQAAWTAHHIQNHTLLGHSPPASQAGRHVDCWASPLAFGLIGCLTSLFISSTLNSTYSMDGISLETDLYARTVEIMQLHIWIRTSINTVR
jgi:hypothetical protein